MYEYRAICTNIVDGDTYDLTIDCGFHITTHQRIRLLGVDTPELRSRDEIERLAAQEAKAFAQHWLIDTQLEEMSFPLKIKTEKSDSFGRWLAEIHYYDVTSDNGLDNWYSLGAELLLAGHAKVYKKK